jgi:hypothetical protein
MGTIGPPTEHGADPAKRDAGMLSFATSKWQVHVSQLVVMVENDCFLSEKISVPEWSVNFIEDMEHFD